MELIDLIIIIIDNILNNNEQIIYYYFISFILENDLKILQIFKN